MFAPPGSPADLVGKVWIDTVLRVQRLSVNSVDDKDFKLRIDPGTTVWDHEHDRVFRLGGAADGPIKDLVAQARQIVKFPSKHIVKPPSNNQRWLIVGCSATVIVLIVTLVIKRSRRRQAMRVSGKGRA